MTGDEFRELALSLAGAVEGSHMGHADFRAGGPKGKIFAALPDEEVGLGMVKLSLDDQEAFIEKAPDVFEPCAGSWGMGGATYVRLAKANRTMVKKAVRCAWENVSGA
ncbi:hypothetical protein PHYC_02736 [Phycisphaerales bacterium]|nr:hypothetical protein PHYC_02736 [Phycisphaerales bacterium]